MTNEQTKPIVLITGGGGGIGTALTEALKSDYTVVSLDRDESDLAHDSIQFDLTADDSVELALRKFRDRYGDHIAAVIHLAAYFDFTGAESPLYEAVNQEGTRRLLRFLQAFEVERFIYSSTMLVHRACVPGERIDESQPVEPAWAYPQSKAATEEVIRAEHGDIPYLLLRLAGLYSEEQAVPTLSHQIARIYERDVKSRFYVGDLNVGQSFVHQDDMIDAFRRAIDRRQELPDDAAILIGEPEAMGYGQIQDTVGRLIHGAEEWDTLTVPKPLARAGAWAELKSEPVVPDAIDQGEKPFIRPFMIDIADDHYALDISRAREWLGWEPKHRIADVLPKMVRSLKRDPVAWYERNGVSEPGWLRQIARVTDDPEALRVHYEEQYARRHARWGWATFLTIGMGSWLVASPMTLSYESAWMVWNDIAVGLAVMVLGFVTLSPRFAMLRWAMAALGVWLLFAPLVFWVPTAEAYLNDMLVGAIIFGLAVAARPAPGVSAAAAETGPDMPPGWSFAPSAWTQRIQIIALAFVGFYLSRYMAAYQLGHIDAVWDPFFAGTVEGKNGTEDIITSRVSEAWPVPDAGLGATVYMLEILTGLVGSQRRWRTMPWLVALFGFLIVPLGIVSITFIIIQPIIIGTWCTLCLIAAAAMLIQIPYSLDELVACGQFLIRRKKAGASLVRVFFFGDTDDTDAGEDRQSTREEDVFGRPPGAVIKNLLLGGVDLPWNFVPLLAIGIWLMFTRVTLGHEGGMADADHLIGSLVLTATIIATAEIARPARFANMGLGAVLLIMPFIMGAGVISTIATVAGAVGLIVFSWRCGPVKNEYGTWSRLIV